MTLLWKDAFFTFLNESLNRGMQFNLTHSMNWLRDSFIRGFNPIKKVFWERG